MSRFGFRTKIRAKDQAASLASHLKVYGIEASGYRFLAPASTSNLMAWPKGLANRIGTPKHLRQLVVVKLPIAPDIGTGPLE
jgi:hypothetical protein